MLTETELQEIYFYVNDARLKAQADARRYPGGSYDATVRELDRLETRIQDERHRPSDLVVYVRKYGEDEVWESALQGGLLHGTEDEDDDPYK